MKQREVPPPLDFEALRTRLVAAPARLLMLDYDGTLAPFCDDPAKATPYPGVIERLRRMMASEHTRLVIVSGRALSSLMPLLDLDPLPELIGSHGWERRCPGGEIEAVALDAEAKRLLGEVHRRIEEEGFTQQCESKPVGLALHWRGLGPAMITLVERRGRSLLERFTESGHFEVRLFDGGVELRARGRSKASAVEGALAESAPGVFAAYLGDDETDEDAFRALDGRGLPVLVRNHAHATHAQAWLHPPDRLLSFLDLWLEVGQ